MRRLLLYGVVILTSYYSSANNLSRVYELANTCQKVSFYDNRSRSIKTDTYYFKPSSLGAFMIYKKGLVALYEGRLLWKPVAVTRNTDDVVIWIPETIGNKFILKNKKTGRYLQWNTSWWVWLPWVHEWGSTKNISSATKFTFDTVKNCESFPEISVNANGEVKKGPNPDGTVYGMADIHDHFLSDGSMSNIIFAGKSYSPYGVYDAFSCYDNHGKKGLSLAKLLEHQSTEETSLFENLINGYFFGLIELHDPYAYPNLNHYPSYSDISHQKGYYQWLNRARLGGLRILTLLSTASPSISKATNQALLKFLLPYFSPGIQIHDGLTGMEEHAIVMNKLHQLINYVDAQEGGPGKGWLKIAYTPEEARKIANNGNLAIIVGAELPDFIDCTEKSAPCSRAYIASQLDLLYKDGVRVVFPVHHYDNQFSGSNIFQGGIELLSMLDKNKPINYQGSENGEYIPEYHQENNAYLAKLILGFFGYDIANGLPKLPKDENGEFFTGYENSKGLTETGSILIEELIKRGMMIDLSHMSQPASRQAMKILDTYNYPPIFSHSSLHNKNEYIYEKGGTISPTLEDGINKEGKECLATSSSLIEVFNALGDVSEKHNGLRSATFSSDFLGTLIGVGPRFNPMYKLCDANSGTPMRYPFTSYDGAIRFEKQVSGNKTYDQNTDGMVHIGMLPDVIEDMRIQPNAAGALKALFNGAEEYIRIWEKCNSSSSLKTDKKIYTNISTKNSPNLKSIQMNKKTVINGLPIALLDQNTVSKNLENMQSNPQIVTMIQEKFDIDITEISTNDIISTLKEAYNITETQINNSAIHNNIKNFDSKEEIAPIYSTPEISIYPTVFNNQINVVSKEVLKNINVTITDLSGKIIFNKTFKNLKNESLDNFKSLSSGVYIVYLKNDKDNFETSFKIVKP